MNSSRIVLNDDQDSVWPTHALTFYTSTTAGPSDLGKEPRGMHIIGPSLPTQVVQLADVNRNFVANNQTVAPLTATGRSAARGCTRENSHAVRE